MLITYDIQGTTLNSLVTSQHPAASIYFYKAQRNNGQVCTSSALTYFI